MMQSKEITLMTTRTLSVPDISCGHCKSTIEGAVGSVEGVEFVEVAVADRAVAVTFTGTEGTFAAIVEAIEGQGYEIAE